MRATDLASQANESCVRFGAVDVISSHTVVLNKGLLCRRSHVPGIAKANPEKPLVVPAFLLLVSTGFKLDTPLVMDIQALTTSSDQLQHRYALCFPWGKLPNSLLDRWSSVVGNNPDVQNVSCMTIANAFLVFHSSNKNIKETMYSFNSELTALIPSLIVYWLL